MQRPSADIKKTTASTAAINNNSTASATSSKNKKKKAAEKGKTNGNSAANAKMVDGTASGSAAAPPPGFGDTKGNGTSNTAIFSDQQQRLLRHRALFAFRFLVGKAVEIQLVDSSRYAGVLDCIDPDDFSIVLKNTRRKSESATAFEDGSTAIFKRNQLAHMSADGVVSYTEASLGSGLGASSGFRTDTEISRRQPEHLFGRELQAASSWLDPHLDTGELEDSRRRSSKSGWNQFEANEKLFGVVSSFDENIYTTKLDKSKFSNEQSREAERIAQEIERQTSANFHLQEERGQASQQDDLDEEARYSSVDRKHSASIVRGQNAYIPPALRNSQRQTSRGKDQPKSETSQAKTANVPSPAKASPATTQRPLSFSDAVTGRSSAASSVTTKSEQKKSVSPKRVPSAVAANGNNSKADSKGADGSKSVEKTPEPVENDGTSAQDDEVKKSTPEATKPESKTEKSSPSTSAQATPTTSKKGLNPNAKEFKLNAAAPSFTPKFASPTLAPVARETLSPYRDAQHQYQHMGGHMHHPQHPHPGGLMYPPVTEEWMYDGMIGMDEGEYVAPYMGYGMPMAPNGPMMQQPVYPPMMPQQNMRMVGGQRPHGGYGYQQHPGYNGRGYYPHSGGMQGGMPYPAGGSGVGPQPPLPREPTPSDQSTLEDPSMPPTPEATESEDISSASHHEAPSNNTAAKSQAASGTKK